MIRSLTGNNGGRATPLRLLGLPLVAAGMLAFSIPADAQETGRIVGSVTSAASGAPASSVQVYLTGTQLGSLTRQNGAYVILNVPVGTHEIVAERIGMGTVTQQVEITAGQVTEVNFQMRAQALGLDEIVVTGTAGAARRREIGNSIAQINVADIPERPTQVFELLQSRAPGIEVTTGGGNLGQGQQIKLRGVNTVSQSNQPIIYVDGVRIMGGAFPKSQGGDHYDLVTFNPGNRGAATTVSPIDQINPNDIERIEVIKGSAATTLYGTEASAGVIQIFTKRGATGAPVWTAGVQQGTGWSRKFGQDHGVPYFWMHHYMRDAWWGGGYSPGPGGDPCSSLSNGGESDTNCSWPGAVWFQNYTTSVRGGTEAFQYFISGGFTNDSGLLALDEQEKWQVRANFTFSPASDLQIQWNSSYSNLDLALTPSANNAQGLELNAFRQNANYFGDGNPLVIASVLDWELVQTNERFTTGGTVTYSPIAELTNRFTIGYDYSIQDSRNHRPFGFNGFPEGALTTQKWTNRVLTFDYVGTFRFPITDDINNSFSWGGQAIGDETHNLTGFGRNFPGATEPTVTTAASVQSWEERERVWNAGFFFQNVFDISNKYFLTMGLRVDGNSAFGEGFGLQAYPKASASWVVSDEDFWSESMGSLKLRAAFGRSGQAPGTFDKVRTWVSGGFHGEPAFIPQNVGNPDLGPEVTSEFEVGFDASWIDDRLSASVTHYRQTTTDALFNVVNVPSEGFIGSQAQNIGELKTWGTEVQLDGAIIQTPTFGWDMGLSFTLTGSEVVDLGGLPSFSTARGYAGGWMIEGEEMLIRRDWLVLNPTEIADPEYERNYNYGSLLPDKTFMVSQTLRLPGNVQLSARGEYRGGNVVRARPFHISRGARAPVCFPYYVDRVASTTLIDSTPALWRARCNPIERQPYTFDASFFKLRTVTATVPVDFAFPESVNDATLTATLANSYLWLKELPWMDPETSGNDGANADVGQIHERTPAPITLHLALQLTF